MGNVVKQKVQPSTDIYSYTYSCIWKKYLLKSGLKTYSDLEHEFWQVKGVWFKYVCGGALLVTYLKDRLLTAWDHITQHIFRRSGIHVLTNQGSFYRKILGTDISLGHKDVPDLYIFAYECLLHFTVETRTDSTCNFGWYSKKQGYGSG